MVLGGHREEFEHIHLLHQVNSFLRLFLKSCRDENGILCQGCLSATVLSLAGDSLGLS